MERNQNSTTFYIVRHGETDWNVRGILQGQTDTELNEAGLKQSEELAEYLRELKFDAVFSSDLSRARKTSEAVALQKKLVVTTSKALRERSFGKYEGKSAISSVKNSERYS